jgi:hypothetical protein
MANARRRRTQRTDDDDFEIDLATALNRLIAANQIGVGDNWYFRIEGSPGAEVLVITRSRAAATQNPDGDA